MLLQLRVSLETDALQKHIQASLCPIWYPERQYDNFDNIYPVISQSEPQFPGISYSIVSLPFNNLSILTGIGFFFNKPGMFNYLVISFISLESEFVFKMCFIQHIRKEFTKIVFNLNPPPNLFSLPQAQIMDFFLKLEADFDKILRMRNKK